MNINIEKVSKDIAFPKDSPINIIVRELASIRSKAILRKLLFELYSVGLADIAKSVEEWEIPNHVAQMPEIGIALTEIRNSNIILSALQLAIYYGLCGALLSVRGILTSPAILWVDGLLINCSGLTIVVADGKYVRICTLNALGETIDFDFEAPVANNRSYSLPKYCLDYGDFLIGDVFPWPPKLYNQPTHLSALNTATHGIKLISLAAPEYIPWLEEAYRGLLIFKVSESERFRSGTEFNLPGLIAVSDNCSPLEMAESLIHECSHQLFFLASISMRFTDSNINESFYSPIRDQHRSTQRVLIGAHAVANISRFYRRLLGCDIYRETAAERFSHFSNWFENDYVTALDSSSALTEGGKLFWRNLKEAYSDI
jgi:hypothetical protein